MKASAAPYLLQPRAPLLEGRFTARFDRFIAELTLADGTPIRAHCVSGMLSLRKHERARP